MIGFKYCLILNGLIFDFEYRLILSMFYVFALRYFLILDRFYVTFQGY